MKTVSLELAKQLKETGFPQEAEFWWVIEDPDWNEEPAVKHKSTLVNKPPRDNVIAAPTADEILDQLPPRIQFKKKVKKNPDWSIDFIPDNELEELKHSGFLTINNPNRWVVNYMSNACFGIQNMAEVFYDDNQNLANAAAKCWLYLKQNKQKTYPAREG